MKWVKLEADGGIGGYVIDSAHSSSSTTLYKLEFRETMMAHDWNPYSGKSRIKPTLIGRLNYE